MKKVFLTVALMMGLTMTTSANEISILNKIADRLSTTNDSVLKTMRFNMELNDKMTPMRRSFLLDDKQSDILFDYQKGVADGFAHLNEIPDSAARQAYFNNIIKYWNQGAKLSFYATERSDAGLMFRKYWNCVNATLKNKGYINEDGKFAGNNK